MSKFNEEKLFNKQPEPETSEFVFGILFGIVGVILRVLITMKFYTWFIVNNLTNLSQGLRLVDIFALSFLMYMFNPYGFSESADVFFKKTSYGYRSVYFCFAYFVIYILGYIVHTFL